MKINVWVSALSVAILLAAAFPLTAQEDHAEVKDSAQGAMDAFITAWNTGDNAKLRATMHFPFITLGGGRMIVANEPADFSTDFEGMRERQQWSRSSFDSFEFMAFSPDRVYCDVEYSRYRADGTRYSGGRVFYIITEKDGHWGIQLRSPGRSSAIEGAARDEAIGGARQAVLDFFTGFNGADPGATAASLNYPHAFLFGGGRMAIAEDDRGPGARPNFSSMRERENWHVSTIDSLEATIVSENKVHFDVVFSRWRLDGTRYTTIPALWVMTRVDGRWGVQFRSLMPPTFDTRGD